MQISRASDQTPDPLIEGQLFSALTNMSNAWDVELRRLKPYILQCVLYLSGKRSPLLLEQPQQCLHVPECIAHNPPNKFQLEGPRPLGHIFMLGLAAAFL